MAEKSIPLRQLKPAASDPGLPEGFSIRRIRDVLGGNDLRHDLHRHDFFFILATETGDGVHEIDFTSYEVTDHSVFILRPGQVHQLTLGRNSTGYLIGFSPDFYYPRDNSSTQLLSRVAGKNACQINKKRPGKIFTVLADIQKEFDTKQEGYREIIRASLGILFIELLRQRRNAPGAPAGTVTYEQEKLEKLLLLIEANVSNNKQVHYYADKLNLSSYQLNAITKATLGKTCSEVISAHVILEAKRHLLATSGQVTQIAYRLGYEDVSYFIRFFKKHTGFTPDAFRQRSR